MRGRRKRRQTNLAEEQLRVYQEAIKRFPTNQWNDRLVRWYLRRDRKQEFERYSRELVERMNDVEVESYLLKFVNAGDAASATKFDANLYSVCIRPRTGGSRTI